MSAELRRYGGDMLQTSLNLDLNSPPRRVETPAARAADPVTSHEAAEEVTRSGRRQRHIEHVIAAVRAPSVRAKMRKIILDLTLNHQSLTFRGKAPSREYTAFYLVGGLHG